MFKMSIAPNTPTAPAGYNGGEIVEFRIAFTLTGSPSYRNNKPGSCGGDVGDIQVKSPKASLVEHDNCRAYAFGFPAENFFYLMSVSEFAQFVAVFSYQDYDSRTKRPKTRIKGDSRRMRQWLERQAQ